VSMYETPTELDALQQLLDTSFASASRHLLSIMEPERRLTAEQLTADLAGIAVLNVATVTARGEPRISAVDGHFLHGCWHFTTDGGSPKARQLRARRAISASYTPRDGYGIFCHGQARFLERGGPEFTLLFDHCVRTYGQSPDEWGSDIAYIRVAPTWMVGFTFTREDA
jgi:Pyridoxamine 5'-phosphate oxidase